MPPVTCLLRELFPAPGSLPPQKLIIHAISFFAGDEICQLGFLKPRIDFFTDFTPQVRTRGQECRDFQRRELVPCFAENLQRTRRVLKECLAERFVCQEPADQNFNAALCHANRLSGVTNAGSMPISGLLQRESPSAIPSSQW